MMNYIMIEEYQILKKIIDQYGFPGLVAFWLMFRTDKKIDKLADLHKEMIDSCKKRDRE